MDGALHGATTFCRRFVAREPAPPAATAIPLRILSEPGSAQSLIPVKKLNRFSPHVLRAINL
jgi:hypothetical protein